MNDSIPGTVSREFYTDCINKYIHYPRTFSGLSRNFFRALIDDNNNYFDKINLTLLNNMYIIIYTYMKDAPDFKKKLLKASGTLNLHPERVKDELFLGHEFFDPNDQVQVKYEMLRRHQIDKKAASTVANTFGTSRQSFYNAEKAFKQGGISGLIGRQRGPKRAHKCSDALLDFAEQWRADDSKNQSNKTLAEEIQDRFGIHLNPRTIDRALMQRKKKRRMKLQGKS